MAGLTMLAQDAGNKWLKDNPAILGLIFLGIGALLLFTGVREWKSGVARGKYGQEYTGGTAKVISGIRLLVGLGMSGFGVTQIFKGLF